jgi:membrane protease subunit (stomatin/prohibitin family)
MAIQNVISTLSDDGQELMEPEVLLYHVPTSSITSGTLLTVESNHFAVVKSRGAILNVYETGQFQITTPEHPIFGSVQRAWYGGQSPWQYEVIYVNRAKIVCSTQGVALSREMAELTYDCDYYVHVNSADGALALVQHMPYRNHRILADDVNAYAGPVIEQAINQLCQVTPLEQINEKIHDITALVKTNLAEFLEAYGISLDTIKVLVRPADERMRALISLKAFGLKEEQAVRYYTAMMMAAKGLVSAPNMACGEPFHIGGATLTSLDALLPHGGPRPDAPARPPAPPPPQAPWGPQ